MIDRTIKAIGGASLLAIVCGLVYTTDCRLSNGANNWDKADSCYMVGFALMGVGGVGVAGVGAYERGYNTYNPKLHVRRPKEDDGNTEDNRR